MAKKSTSSKKKAETKKASKPAAKAKGVKYQEIVFDNEEKRDEICLQIKGEQYWFPRKQIKIHTSTSSVEIPKWLRDLKGM
jgi:hypothetical protein